MKGKRNIDRIDPELISERFIKDFYFTPMQKKVIELVYKMRAIRVSQIARIMDYHQHYVRQQLRELYYNRFLDRNYPWEEKIIVNNGLGSVEGVYMLDEAGRIAITGLLGIDIREVKWKPIENLVKYEKLKHTLQCSEILARVFEESRNAACKVVDFASEKFLWKKFAYQNTQYEVCPDIYINILKEKSTYCYFVENDEATMDIRSFLAKIPKYDNYKISGQFENEYEIFPRVLVITTSKDRALTFAKEVGKKQKSKVEFFFTWHDIFYEIPFGSKTFIHTSVEKYPRTYSMFDELPEETKIGYEEKQEEVDRIQNQ